MQDGNVAAQAPSSKGVTDRLVRLARTHQLATDAVVAVALCTGTLVAAATDPRRLGGTITLAAALAAVVAYSALLLRRRWPVVALAVTILAAAAYMMFTSTHGWVAAAPLVALYHLADVTADRFRLLAIGGLAVATLDVLMVFSAKQRLGAENLAMTAVCGLALAAGDAARSRRAYIGEIEERARRAAYDREQETRRQVVEERLRVARDLHDSMGHHIALITAQAALAGYVMEDQPATAKDALGHIREAGRAALDDLRDTIRLLRQGDESSAPTEPAGGVAAVDDLVVSLRQSGMRVRHEVIGPVRPLPTATDLTVFRVVQEALTNVRKHACGAAARVQVIFAPDVVTVSVTDDGPGLSGVSPAEQGDCEHGIIGMRERVVAVGGVLMVGPGDTGGFRVSAELPVPAVVA